MSTIIEQHEPQQVERVPAASRPTRLVRRVWMCGTNGCATRAFYPGPLCPRCRKLGEPARAKPLG